MEQLPALIMVLKLLKSIVYPSEKMIIISFGVFMICVVLLLTMMPYCSISTVPQSKIMMTMHASTCV